MSHKLQFVEASQQSYSRREKQQTEVCWTLEKLTLQNNK